ncbi:MAG: hypothetical protein GY845_03445 [Planctomycetes bacterium]|nr:hypothetical protein [Planctomycetota bacterium]
MGIPKTVRIGDKDISTSSGPSIGRTGVYAKSLSIAGVWWNLIMTPFWNNVMTPYWNITMDSEA